MMKGAATFSHKLSTRFSVRSISLPARSHPTTAKVEQELNKLRSCCNESSPSSICSSLSGLADLYACINDLLNSPLTQQALSQHQHLKWVRELAHSSVTYLDICDKTRDAILLFKESVRQLQSALRRRKWGDMGVENGVASYMSSRRKTKREITKCMATLKHQMDAAVSPRLLLDQDDHLCAVALALREASYMTGSVFWSLLQWQYLSVSTPKTKSSRWAMLSKRVQRQSMGELQGLEDIHIALNSNDNFLLILNSSSSNAADQVDKIKSAHKRLEGLDGSLEGLENGLECLFRQLIHARVSLLNMFSPHS